MAMRAIEAKTFSGYGGLRQTELPRPQPAKERVLVRVTAAGVTPLDHTILSGGRPRAKAPLVLAARAAQGATGTSARPRIAGFTEPYVKLRMAEWQDYMRQLTEWEREHTLDI
jgi:NADPH:quinone reductase